MQTEKKALAGSFTIEATLVMAIIIMSVAVLILQSYRIHDEIKLAVRLHRGVEQMSFEQAETKPVQKKLNTGFLLSVVPGRADIERSGGKITGTLDGRTKSGLWSVSIEGRVYKPEEFLRQMAALKQLEEQNENQLHQADAP